MWIYRISLVLALILFAAATHFGQKKDITEQEFQSAVQSSRDKGGEYNSTVAAKMDEFEGTKVLRSYEWTTETLLPGRRHWIFTRVQQGKTLTTEQIEIGKIHYCRDGSGRWSIKDCTDAVLGRGFDAVARRFSYDESQCEGEKMSHYVSYATGGDEADSHFMETEVWIDGNGRIRCELRRIGAVKTGIVSNLITGTYEYNPKGLKIEAPIK